MEGKKMKTFMDKDFLLQTDTAKKLYNDYAAATPILDYHCHINPQEIYEDRQFENITQVWLGGDHYKWRFMRSCGVDERFITGDASDKEKFLKWAEVLGKAIGNPLFHWSHLELQKYFGYHGVLNKNTAEEVWELCNKRLAQPDMTVRNIIKQSNVTLICTTDDPVDSLEWHKKIAEDASFDVKVLPAWRPDKAMNIEKPTYLEYLDQLSTVSGIKVASFADLCKALSNRMDFFASMGCCVSDHASRVCNVRSCFRRGDREHLRKTSRRKRCHQGRRVKVQDSIHGQCRQRVCKAQLGNAAALRLQARQQHTDV